MALAASLDAEQRRAVQEGLNDEELALFDLILRKDLPKNRSGTCQTGEQVAAREVA